MCRRAASAREAPPNADAADLALYHKLNKNWTTLILFASLE
jgi:hypothetical protein